MDYSIDLDYANELKTVRRTRGGNYVSETICYCCLCDMPKRVSLSDVKRRYILRPYVCIGCSNKYNTRDISHEQYKEIHKKAIATMGPEGLSSRTRVQNERLGIEGRASRAKSAVSKRDYRAIYNKRVENGTFMRSKLELDIEEEFGGQHSSPEFKMELDNYWPELKCGVEVDTQDHAKKRFNYHHEKKAYFDSLGIRVLFLSLSPNAVRRPGYSGWRDLVAAHLRGEVPDDQLIMWDDPYHFNG